MKNTPSRWHSFIQEQHIPALTLQVLQNPPKSWLCDLSQWEILSISGADASKFLQGQISCDINKLDQEHAQLAACINLKGRLFSNFIVYKVNDSTFLLLCPPKTLQITEKILKKYAIFSKVTIEEDFSFSLSAGRHVDTQSNSDIQSFGIPAVDFQFYLAPSDLMETLWSSSQSIMNSQFFDYQTIQQALVFISPQSSELFTPQEINFELVQGIDFKKGCYTGQEVVARLHYRGTPKRRCYIAELAAQNISSTELEIRDSKNKAQGHQLQSITIKNTTFMLISLSIQSYEAFKLNPQTNSLHIADESIFTRINTPPYPLSTSP